MDDDDKCQSIFTVLCFTFDLSIKKSFTPQTIWDPQDVLDLPK